MVIFLVALLLIAVIGCGGNETDSGNFRIRRSEFTPSPTPDFLRPRTFPPCPEALKNDRAHLENVDHEVAVKARHLNTLTVGFHGMWGPVLRPGFMLQKVNADKIKKDLKPIQTEVSSLIEELSEVIKFCEKFLDDNKSYSGCEINSQIWRVSVDETSCLDFKSAANNAAKIKHSFDEVERLIDSNTL